MHQAGFKESIRMSLVGDIEHKVVRLAILAYNVDCTAITIAIAKKNKKQKKLPEKCITKKRRQVFKLY